MLNLQYNIKVEYQLTSGLTVEGTLDDIPFDVSKVKIIQTIFFVDVKGSINSEKKVFNLYIGEMFDVEEALNNTTDKTIRSILLKLLSSGYKNTAFVTIYEKGELIFLGPDDAVFTTYQQLQEQIFEINKAYKLLNGVMENTVRKKII